MGQYGRIASLADLPDDADADGTDAQCRGADRQRGRAEAGAGGAEAGGRGAAGARRGAGADAAASATFYDRFAPSHRREYCEWVAEAKRDETRAQTGRANASNGCARASSATGSISNC